MASVEAAPRRGEPCSREEENDLITRTGPETPMGNAMRHYWVPACLSRDIAEPDGAPVRIKLMGEELVAFRDTEGASASSRIIVRIVACRSFFGRNEECGLRCVYHGWKFDVTGACIDQLNEPEELQFKLQGAADGLSDLRARRHRLGLSRASGENAAIAEVRLDPGCRKPAVTSPRSSRTATICRRSKAASTHRTRRSCTACLPTTRPAAASSRRARSCAARHRRGGRHHRLRLSLCRRAAARREEHSRADLSLHLPFHQIRPSRSASGLPTDAGHIWVPIDDHCRMVYNWIYSTGEGPLTEEDWLERRPRQLVRCMSTRRPSVRCKNRSNTYGLDREVQRTESWEAVSTGSTSRTAPCRKAWVGSSIAAANISARPTRRSVQARTLRDVAKATRPG